ncbi:hypothetical protein MICA_2397 [Micavibrio aeruginosavorus ARL-13]|uniref:Uncharacterized protein n=1 Tax=Micavibrio aeruginosavorus (strain ARL-13) TaxID=856793 RepID=G2KMK6_MICAA|nr:hypothetical protein MICA_2397 [Micavibrio aeruginosavorus ARL-13]
MIYNNNTPIRPGFARGEWSFPVFCPVSGEFGEMLCNMM